MPSLRHRKLLAAFFAVTTLWLGLESLRAADANPPARGRELATQIGCAQCHAELAPNPTLRELAPNLGSAGLRYQPAWLFEFLQNPTHIRQHLGAARMPDFGLSKQEALALTAFLETQRQPVGQWPALPSGLETHTTTPPVSATDFHAELARGLICLSCHDYAGQGGHRAVELTNVSVRVRREWMIDYLVAPAKFGVAPATMPPQFFQPADDRSQFNEVTPGAAGKIQRLTSHLFSLNAGRRTTLEQNLSAARREHPGITATHGEALFRALNCAACHRHPTIAPRTNAAPSLAGEGLRAEKAWLEGFLRKPHSIRPSGYEPGDGARMPDFRLTPEEAKSIATFLLSQRDGPAALKTEYHPMPRSAFAMSKAALLLRDKLSCLGCHSLEDKGGRIGPDFAHTRSRLQPGYVLNIIRDPHAIAPHSIMPQAPLSDDTARLIADFLLQRDSPSLQTTYLSPLEYRVIAPIGGSRAARNYASHCAPCHGTDGRGDGFNAAFLRVKPTLHADARIMSQRPDDTLFDGIHAGGAILNKSHHMPAWGTKFSTEEIRELVAHLRALCQCDGPEWSRDGAK